MAGRFTSAGRRKDGTATKGKPHPRAATVVGDDDWLRAGHEHTGRMLQQLFCVVMEFAHRQGLSVSDASQAFRRAQRQVKRSPYRLADAERFETLLQISELLATWYREAAFLDESGEPKPLPVAGTKSFTTLARRYLPNFAPEQVAGMMVREKLLEPRTNDRVVPRRRAAMFAKQNPMTLDRIAVLVQGLMSTVAHNASDEGRAEGTRCERSTTIAQLPAELIPAFNENIKIWAQSLLDKTDSWARQRELAEDSPATRRSARVGVEVFAYVEANKGHASRRAPRGRA